MTKAMYNGSMLSHVVATLSTYFNIEDGYIAQLNDALIQLQGEGVEDLLDDVGVAGQ